MSKKIAILQSNYIPWKGYFDLINIVDEFIFHDDVQYTHGDWRNRNKIKTQRGTAWLSVPCGKSEKRLICEVVLNDSSWQKEHWAKIEANYKKTKYFNDYKDFFKDIYLGIKWENLSELNQYIIKKISKEILDIDTKFDDSRNYYLQSRKADRVLELLKKVDATVYLSGPSAKNYLEEDIFIQNNIGLEWMDYSGYNEYTQLHPPFNHEVSILDLIFNEGPNTTKFMKSFKDK